MARSLREASKQHEFVALVNQAGGALTWNSSPTLQRELSAAARKIKVAALCMDSEKRCHDRPKYYFALSALSM